MQVASHGRGHIVCEQIGWTFPATDHNSTRWWSHVDSTEVDKTSKESVPVEQEQPLRAAEPDQVVLRGKTQRQRGILEFTHLLLGSWYTACVYGEVADDLHRRRRQDPDLENASVDRADIAAVTGPNEVTKYRVQVGCDRLDEWRFGECNFKSQNGRTERTLQNIVDQSRRFKTIPRNTPRYSHDGLGHCESSIKEVEKQKSTATDVQHGRLHNAQSKLRNKRHSSSW